MSIAVNNVEDHRCSLAQLEAALAMLDEKLEAAGVSEPVVIRAIGGFALMKYGIRAKARAFTVDIDTVTRAFSPQVSALIHEVAGELNLDRDWINNDNMIDADDPELVESMYQARWVADTRSSYRHIDLMIASVPTLTRAKIIAADTPQSGRTQDVPDLIELLMHQRITTIETFERIYPDTDIEYPEAHQAVQSHLARVA